MDLVKNIDDTFLFDEKELRVVGEMDDPWFVAKDICKILDIKDNRSGLRIVQEDCKKEFTIKTGGGNQKMSVINEAGLYRLIMRSNKPIAEKFQKIVCNEILPQLRRKGEVKLKQFYEEKIKALEEENKEISRRVFRRSKTHYNAGECVYIVVNKTIKDKFKLGQTDNINKRLQSFNNANPEEFEVYKHWYTYRIG